MRTEKIAKQTPLPADVEVIRNAEYGTGGGQALRMHLLRPKTPARDEMDNWSAIATFQTQLVLRAPRWHLYR